METPPQRFARLLVALEDLADQEAASVRVKDYPTVFSLQSRAAPIVAELAAADPSAVAPAVRQRLSALVKRRQATVDAIQQQLDSTREQMTAIQQSLRNISRVAPVYGRPAVRRSSLAAVG